MNAAKSFEYAAILHDIGHQVQARSATHGGHGAATYHPIIGVGIAKQYITELPAPSQEAILDAVQHHHGETLPSTDVGRIVRDADRLVSTTNPETLALRAFQYRVDNGMAPNEAAKNAYHYLRHRKLTRLQGRQASFLTPQGEQMFKDNISRLDSATKTYEDYAKLINARSGNTLVETNYKTAALGAELSFPSPDPQKKYVQDTEALLKQYKWTKPIQSIIANSIKDSKSMYQSAMADVKMQAADKKFDQDLAMRKMDLEEKKVNAEIKNKAMEAKQKPLKKTVDHKVSKAKVEKKASILDPLLGYHKSDGMVDISLHRGNSIMKDTEEAIRNYNVDDGFHDARRRVLLGDAAMLAGAGLVGLGMAKAAPNIGERALSAQDVSKLQHYARMAGGTAIVGGLYGAYAHKDDEDKTKRNIALGIAGAGALGLQALPLPQNAKSAVIPTAELKRISPYILGGAALTTGGAATTLHNGGAIADAQNVESAMRSGAGYTTVAHNVNTIRNKKSISQKYPLARYFSNVPYVDKLITAPLGNPASVLSDKDEKYYAEAQTDKLFNEFCRAYEAINGKATQEELTKIRANAARQVLEEIAKARSAK